MPATMDRERRWRCEEEDEVGEERMRLKICHASFGLLELLDRALASLAV